jgi:hypothetical protein
MGTPTFPARSNSWQPAGDDESPSADEADNAQKESGQRRAPWMIATTTMTSSVTR